MPLSPTFEHHPLIERAVRLRENPFAAYGIAVGAIGVATLARWAVQGHAMEGTPFITFYPAIVIAALVGGFWPGVVATIASAVVAWILFIPPTFSFALTRPEAVSLFLFIFVSGINVVVVALLNEAVNRILAQEKNTRTLIESAPNGIVVVDQHGAINLVNRSAEKQFGYERPELIGKSIEILVPVNRRVMHEIERQAFQLHPASRPMGAGRDLSGRRKDGSEFPVEIGLNTVTRNGRAAVLATVIDISERKEAQEHQKFLIKELEHRSQNLFAVIQAIGTRSLGEGHTPKETLAIFTGRLQALARAHAMLAEAAWISAPLSEIIKRELEVFSKNVTLSGCDVAVNTVAAQHFALIVHELATNAIKHGSLSAPAGRVLVAGKVHKLDGNAMFFFSWKESGGPKVTRPRTKGFGSSILVDGAKGFGGQVALNFEPDGLSYELQFALTQIEPQGKASTPSVQRAG